MDNNLLLTLHNILNRRSDVPRDRLHLAYVPPATAEQIDRSINRLASEGKVVVAGDTIKRGPRFGRKPELKPLPYDYLD